MPSAATGRRYCTSRAAVADSQPGIPIPEAQDEPALDLGSPAGQVDHSRNSAPVPSAARLPQIRWQARPPGLPPDSRHSKSRARDTSDQMAQDTATAPAYSALSMFASYGRTCWRAGSPRPGRGEGERWPYGRGRSSPWPVARARHCHHGGAGRRPDRLATMTGWLVMTPGPCRGGCTGWSFWTVPGPRGRSDGCALSPPWLPRPPPGPGTGLPAAGGGPWQRGQALLASGWWREALAPKPPARAELDNLMRELGARAPAACGTDQPVRHDL